jgi:glycosyltransferase involved in cell wall biosynthesis
MRIAHVTPLFPPSVGGMERCVYSLAECQVKQGHTVTIFTSNVPQLRIVSGDFNNVGRVFRLRSFLVKGSPVSPNLIPKLCEDTYDIIHQHIFHFYYPESTLIASKLKRIPLVSHIHMDPDLANAAFFQRMYKRPTASLVMRFSDAIIVPTKAYGNLISRKYDCASKLSVIPNGINIKTFSTIKQNRELFDILFIGRIEEQKGLDSLIKAMPLVLDSIPDAKLRVIGPCEDNSYLNYIKSLVSANNLEKHIKFEGSVSEKALHDLLGQSSMLVIPSRFESFGLVLLEGMASGIPVLASNIPEFREIAGGCVFFSGTLPEELSENMLTLLSNNSLRLNLVSHAKERVKEYNWDLVNRKIMALYSKCIRKK